MANKLTHTFKPGESMAAISKGGLEVYAKGSRIYCRRINTARPKRKRRKRRSFFGW